ncbi:MAG: PIN domain-containing protein [Cyanobacteria bacterium]|nr:PIN domain-containing protein [Cyanobacteriota bacterium]
MKVEATIYDINHDQPQKTDRFIVDANVWVWVTFSAYSLEERDAQRSMCYQNYLLSIRSCKAKVFHSPLQVSEVASVVENLLFDVYLKMPSANPSTKKKDFRQMLDQRAKVVSEVNSCINIIRKVSGPLPLPDSTLLLDGMVDRFSRLPLDAYDAALLTQAEAAGIYQVITDDSDFAAVKGIQMYTCNERVLRSAPKHCIRGLN